MDIMLNNVVYSEGQIFQLVDDLVAEVEELKLKIVELEQAVAAKNELNLNLALQLEAQKAMYWADHMQVRKPRAIEASCNCGTCGWHGVVSETHPLVDGALGCPKCGHDLETKPFGEIA